MLTCEHIATGWAVDVGEAKAYNAGLVRLVVGYHPFQEDLRRHREFTLEPVDVARLLAAQSVVLGPGLVAIKLERLFGGKTSEVERTCLVVRETGQVVTFVFDDFQWSHLHDALEAAAREAGEVKEDGEADAAR